MRGCFSHAYLFFEILFSSPRPKAWDDATAPNIPQAAKLKQITVLNKGGYSLDNDLSFPKKIFVYLFLSPFISGYLFLHLHPGQLQMSPVNFDLPKPLFPPHIRPVVIPRLLPKTAPVTRHELQRPQPLRALP